MAYISMFPVSSNLFDLCLLSFSFLTSPLLVVFLFFVVILLPPSVEPSSPA